MLFKKYFHAIFIALVILAIPGSSLFGQNKKENIKKAGLKEPTIYFSLDSALKHKKAVKELNLSTVNVNFDDIINFPFLEKLVLANNNEIKFRNDSNLFARSTNLKELVITGYSGINLSYLFCSIYKSNINNLKLSNDKIESLPTGMIKYLSRLTSLDLSGNPLHSIPSEIKRLINLEKLILANCELNKISFTDLSYLKKLKKLDISGNKIETIPDQIGRLVGLTELSLSATGINALSDSISRLKQLKILNISKNRLNNTSFDKLYENKGLTNLDVSNNKIDIVPEGIGIFQQLSKLDLSENSILSLPDSLCLLEKLTDLKVKSSRVSISDIILPAKILNLKNLNEIDFVHELMLTAKKSEIEKENKKLLADFLTIGLIFMVVVAIFIYIFYRRYRHQKDMYKENYETLKKTKDMLIESEKLASLGSLVAGVAHEINNPLGIGVTDSSFLINKTRKIKDVYAEGKMTHEDFEDFLEDIIKISSRMNNNLLRAGSLVQSFKKLSVDQFVDEKSRFNVKAYFEELLLSLKPVFKGKEIDITLNGDDNIEINSNPGLFAQIITNFVINSVKHGFIDRNNGHIKLDIFKKDNRLNIIYYDNGSGIAEQHLSRIFEFFFTTGGGTGLGLNIVYNIVQKLKGNIKCESKEGEFTQFTIDIPIEI